MKKKLIETMTPEQAAKVAVYREKWLKNGLRTDPIPFDVAVSECRWLYGQFLKDYSPDPIVFLARSPWEGLLMANRIALTLKQKPGQLGGQLDGQLRGQLGGQLDGQLDGQLRGQLDGQLRGQLDGQLRGQLRGQLDGQLDDQLDGQLRGQLGGQLGGQLDGQLRGQLRGQLDGQLDDQLDGQLRGQLGGQLGGQLDGQLGGQLDGQLRGQLRGQLDGQLDDQLDGQLRGQLGGQLGGQLDGQLGGQLDGQLRGQLRGQLGGQLGGQLDGQLDGQLGGQLGGQLDGQLRGQLDGQLRGQLDDQLDDQLGGQLGGQLGVERAKIPLQWAYYRAQAWWWVGFYGFYDFVLEELLPQEKPKFALFDRYRQHLERVNWIIPMKGVCIAVQRPTEIHFGPTQTRRGWYSGMELQIPVLHRDGGPVVKYADGWEMHALNGVRVPKEIAETPAAELKAELLIKQTNAQVRAEIARKIGVERLCKDLNAETVDKEGSYELLMLDLGDGRKRPYLKMQNPSVELVHIEGVKPGIATVSDALTWRNGTEIRPTLLS